MRSDKPLNEQVNSHHINWSAFNDVKAMIELADAREGISYEEYPRRRRKHRHIVRTRVRDANVTH